MKTPVRKQYTLPGRYIVTNNPSKLDWSDVLEAGEILQTVTIRMIEGDTVVDRVTTENGFTTYWLSGGTLQVRKHRMQVIFTSSEAQTDSVMIDWQMLD